MPDLKVLVLAFPGNPTCRNWIYGLKQLGYQVAFLIWSQSSLSAIQLEEWGISPSEVPVFHMWNDFPESTGRKISTVLGGKPDLIFSWEGALILNPLRMVKQFFSSSKVVHCVNTFPNANSWFTELRMYQRYRSTDAVINSYVFYSDYMRRLFCQKIETATGKPYFNIVEPFLEKAFDGYADHQPDIPKLERVDNSPYVIFTGRGSALWKTFSLGDRRDALGNFFKKLAARGVHVFLSPNSDTKNLPNLHHYPYFSNQDLYEGRFAQYISQFDAHVVMYNECSGTMKRWVSTGLSTRFAYALTATAPLAVSQTSQFAEELWHDLPFGFSFQNPIDLSISLHDRSKLALLRSNMQQVHRSYSFESQARRIADFFESIASKTVAPVS